jgi:mannosyltransferase OCH1-like enzyme
MAKWLFICACVSTVLFLAMLVATCLLFARPAQILFRKELRGDLPTSVYPIDIDRHPPPSPPHNRIPKLIFRTWEDNSWKTKCHKAYDHTAKILPDWPQRVFTGADRRAFVRDVYKAYPAILDAYDLCNYGVMECDLWRHLVIYHHGGLYLDMKSGVLRPIDLKLEVDRAYVGHWHSPNHTYLFQGGEYQNWWVMAPPKSEFLWTLIWQIVRNLFYLRDHDQQAAFFRLSSLTSVSKSNIMSIGGPIVYTYVALTNPHTVNNLGLAPNEYFSFCALAGHEYNQKASTHYSQQTKPLLKARVVASQLSRHLEFKPHPKVLHMTYISRERVPQFVWDNLSKYTEGYEVRFYSDAECIEYLSRHYGPEVLRCWKRQEKGAHKADLFRYAVLYREGGVYLDIKADLRQPLREIFDDKVPFTSVETRFPDGRRNIHNAVLSAAKGHPVMHYALAFACKTIRFPNMHYHANLDYMHALLRREVDGQVLEVGLTTGRRTTFVLHEERFKKGNDRYGLDNSIVRADGVVLSKTRYLNFGSWK